MELESRQMSRCKVKNYYNQHLRRRQQNIQQQRSMFLPIMLCARTSVKDVNFSHQNRRQTSSPSSPPVAVGCVCQSTRRNNKVVSVVTNPSPVVINPSSAAVIKSLNNNNNTNGRTAAAAAAKKHKTRKFLFFGSKSVTATTPKKEAHDDNTETVPPARGGEQKSAHGGEEESGRGEIRLARRGNTSCDNDRRCRIRAKCVGSRAACRIGIIARDLKPPPIDIASLDPPLPVVKRQPQSESDREESESLWKRRSGGPALRCLQLQPIHVGVAPVGQISEAKTV